MAYGHANLHTGHWGDKQLRLLEYLLKGSNVLLGYHFPSGLLFCYCMGIAGKISNTHQSNFELCKRSEIPSK